VTSWRETKAAACEVEVDRLTEFLVDLDDVEQLCLDDETICIELRKLAGRVRSRIGDRRDEGRALRAALEDWAERAER